MAEYANSCPYILDVLVFWPDLTCKEKKNAERFNMLMAATEKKLKLIEKKSMLEKKKVGIAAASEDIKMLTH